ncbi:hypothetical protein J2S03_003129 [Alicyclobacillus cycloheptanicus]|uniref:Uncharacterized protein n=1 Tax=Alicyclobacillus cycloheptanicus TaxID=1457 RepID=A0ABT9XLS0_9BACL|nr:hypothetical protein [Alicyclobacillus cycloheptanicus]
MCRQSSVVPGLAFYPFRNENLVRGWNNDEYGWVDLGQAH